MGGVVGRPPSAAKSSARNVSSRESAKRITNDISKANEPSKPKENEASPLHVPSHAPSDNSADAPSRSGSQRSSRVVMADNHVFPMNSLGTNDSHTHEHSEESPKHDTSFAASFLMPTLPVLPPLPRFMQSKALAKATETCGRVKGQLSIRASQSTMASSIRSFNTHRYMAKRFPSIHSAAAKSEQTPVIHSSLQAESADPSDNYSPVFNSSISSHILSQFFGHEDNQQEKYMTDLGIHSVRIFLSSTFRDMTDERNHLVRKVFPELREMLYAKGIILTEVDLRWGITLQESQSGKVALLCLQEIDRCKYFVCFIGDRYGWIPDRSDPSQYDPMIDQMYPWLTKCLGISVTEMEIRHGALNKRSDPLGSLFYFRKQPPDNEQSQSDTLKQNALKKEIAKSFPVLTFSSPEQLGSSISDGLKELIAKDFPDNQDEISQKAREDLSHNQFGLFYMLYFQGRSEALSKILAFIQQKSSTPLLILGPPGMGKTALVAKVASALDRQNTITHHVGCTSDSIQLDFTLARILDACTHETSVFSTNILSDFARGLDGLKSSQTQKVVIVDGINNFEEDESRPSELQWIPPVLPQTVRFILTCPEEHHSVQIAKRNNWSVIRLEGLSAEEIEKVATNYLAMFSKKLTTEQMQLLCSSQSCSLPAFLLVALYELRIAGVFEKLTEKINQIIHLETVADLFFTIIERWRTDFVDVIRPRMVEETLCMLALSRSGFHEEEILSFVGSPQYLWQPFFIALKEFLFSRHGRFVYSQEQYRSAVQSRFFPTGNAYKAVVSTFRTRIGQFLEQRKDVLDTEGLFEIAYQYALAGDWPRLKEYLCNDRSADKLLSSHLRSELMKFWRDLQRNGYDVATEYTNKLLATWDMHRAIRVAKLFLNMALYDNARIILETVYQDLRQQDNPSLQIAIMNDLAQLYKESGAAAKAIEMYESALTLLPEISKANGKGEKELVMRDNLASCLMLMGRYAEAESEFRRVLDKRLTLLPPTHPDIGISHHHMAKLASRVGRLQDALTHHTAALDILRLHFVDDHPLMSSVLCDGASFLARAGDVAKSLAKFQDMLRVVESLYGQAHPSVARVLENMAQLLIQTSEHQQALALLQRAEKIYLTTHGDQHPALCGPYITAANLLGSLKRFDDAVGYYVKALHLYQAQYGTRSDHVASTLFSIGLVCVDAGRDQEAFSYLERALDTREHLFGKNHPLLVEILKALGNLKERAGKTQEAVEIYERVIGILATWPEADEQDIETAYFNAGILYYNLMNDEKALEWFQKALSLQKKLYGESDERTKSTEDYIQSIVSVDA